MIDDAFLRDVHRPENHQNEAEQLNEFRPAIAVSEATNPAFIPVIMFKRMPCSVAKMFHDAAKMTSRQPNFLACLALLGLVSLVGGCAGASAISIASLMGSPNASALEIHNNTDVRLQANNFIVIKTNVVGQSSGFSLLGILTIVPAKFTKAMSRLYVQAEMQPGRPQTLVNLVLEKDSTYLILFSIPRTAIRADVIEFISATTPELQPQPPNGLKTD